MTAEHRSRTEDRQESWRLFAAVPVSDAVRDLMPAVRRDLERQDWAVRWVDPELAHLTVKFFGDTSPKRIPSLEQKLALAASQNPSFRLATANFILLGPRRRPNVLSLAVDSAADDPAAMERFTQLAEQVERQTSSIGSGGNNRSFKAHITLGRFKDRDGAPADVFDVLRAHQPPPCQFVVDRLQLIRSVLSSAGPTYTTLMEWRLGQEFAADPVGQPETLEHG